MIPIRLQLHNFMSYGSDIQSLDFSGIDLACLSGNNGVGKSTLLDAITWVLWGKCRASHDDDLVKQGQWDMWVSFEFNLEGQKHRVIRKRSKRGKGQGSLEFLVSTKSQESDKVIMQESFGNWASLNGASKAETQQKIIDTLRMQYDTFINSAFLRQGHADEFTVRRPAERKAILGEILGLEIYDRLETQAKEQIRNKKIEKESLKSLLEAARAQLKDKSIYQKQVERVEKSLASASKKIKKKEEEAVKLQEKKADLEAKVKQVKELKRRIADFTKDIQDLDQDVEKHDRVINAGQRLITQRDDIKEKFAEYKKNIKLQEKYDQKAKLIATLVEEKRVIESKIVDAKHSLEVQRGKIQAKLEGLKERINKKLDLEEKKRKFSKELDLVIQKEKEINGLERDFHEIKERLAEMKAEVRQTKATGEDIKGKINSLSKAQATCPLCKQDLSSKHRHLVIQDLTQELDCLRKRYKNLKARETAFKEKTDSLEEEIKEGKMKLSGKKEIEAKLAEVNKDLREMKELVLEEKKLQDIDEMLSRQIKESKYDPEDFKKLEELNSKIKKIGYDEKKYNNVRDHVKKLEKYGELKSKLDQAQERIEDASKAKARIVEIIKRKKEAIKKEIKEEEALTESIKELEEVTRNLDQKNKELMEIRAEVSGVEKSYGAAKEKYERLIKLEKEVKEKKQKLEEVALEVAIYDELALAFSKKGVQAMIIESAVPEIEEEANKLLSKMTDGKMKVEFRTQREKKTDGELAETLDIQIADEQGIRPYEMFSGGEAYRINFAIRIALSKLLARRAGAKLQFLVIDEGFGTQDTLGREHLVEAINSISKDFKKILVVTHVPELRDVFPNRIEVTKDEEGSHFRIIG